LIIVISLLGFCKKQTVPDYTNIQLWATGSDIRIRSAPSVNSKVLGVIKKGYKVNLLEKGEKKEVIEGKEGSWHKISFEGSDFKEIIGFVFSAYFVSDEEGPQVLKKKLVSLKRVTQKKQ